MRKGRKILLIENFSSDFYKARLPLAKYLQVKGWNVYVLIPDGEYVDLIQKEGIKVIGYELDRKNKGIIQLLKLIKIYQNIIREHNIDIIHSFRFQPNLVNVLANFFNKRKVFIHITGLGIAFSNSSFFYLMLRFVSQIIFLVKFFRADRVIVQNDDDAKDILLAKFWNKKTRVINGSGVNTSLFDKNRFDKVSLRKSAGIPEHDKIVICVTRLLWEKGIREMANAFMTLQHSHSYIKLWIVGWSDKDNPRHVEDEFIKSFEDENTIRFLGRRENIPELLAMSDVFIYPSYYREGIPRGVLEALSMSLPIIVTDMPGCRLTVNQGRNGNLIAPKSSLEIKESIIKIFQEKNLEDMGHESRLLVVNRFSNNAIFSEIEGLYEE